MELLQQFGITPTFTEETMVDLKEEQLSLQLYEQAYAHYQERRVAIANKTFPVIARVFAQRGESTENIVVPFSDRIKLLQVVANLKQANESKCQSLLDVMEQRITLAIIDHSWKEHLREMDELKQQVQNAVHEQKDPLLIYKLESYELFQNFIHTLNQDLVSFLSKADLPITEEKDVRASRARQEQQRRKLREQKAEARPTLGDRKSPEAAPKAVAVTKPIIAQKKYGRIDRVKVKYADGAIKQVKYKKVEQDILSNKCVVV